MKNQSLLKKIIVVALLVLFFAGCQNNNEAKDENTGNATETQNQETQDNEKSAEAEKVIDEDTGLVYERSLDLKYAKSFSVDYYEGGYKKITDWNGRKTLLVPEGAEVPEVKEGIDIIQLPINKIGVFTTTVAPELRPINSLDKVSLVTTKKEQWHVDEIIKGMDEGKIIYVGKNSAPDFEVIEQNRPDVIFITTGTGHGSDEVTMKLDELGIKWVSHSSQRETDPRGRLEWVKFDAVFLDKEEEAAAFYDAQLEKIAKVEEKTSDLTERKTFATTFISKDVFYVRNQGDYEVKMFEMSGGKYILPDLNPEKDGNTKMNAEEFYAAAQNADILFYNTINGPTVQSISDLIAAADYLKDIKAVKNGQVWGFKPDYYQSLDYVADMIGELNEILITPAGEITETEHFFLLQ